MATELELKAVVADPVALKQRLSGAGARRAFRGFLHDRRLDRAGELGKKGEVLRIRRWRPEGGDGERVVVGWKGKAEVHPGGYKRLDELECEATPGAMAEAILARLGFEVVHAIDRFVEVWDHEGTTVRLEWYPRLDVLAEIEGTPEGIERTVRVAGLDRSACLPDPLSAFVARYEARTGQPAVLAEAGLAGAEPGWGRA